MATLFHKSCDQPAHIIEVVSPTVVRFIVCSELLLKIIKDFEKLSLLATADLLGLFRDGRV